MGKMPSEVPLSNSERKIPNKMPLRRSYTMGGGWYCTELFLEQWELRYTSMLGERGGREAQWVHKKKKTTENTEKKTYTFLRCLYMLCFYVSKQKLRLKNYQNKLPADGSASTKKEQHTHTVRTSVLGWNPKACPQHRGSQTLTCKKDRYNNTYLDVR